MSLKLKIIICFLMCILFIFLPLFYLIESYFKPMNMKNAEHQITQLIDSKANEIGSWLNQRVSEIRIIKEYPSCKELDFNQLKPYIINLNKILNKNYGNSTETFAIGGLDGKGWINDNITIDVSRRPYFKEAMATNQEYVISNPVISKSDNNHIFLICYPIHNTKGDKVGFINGAVNLELLSQITKEIELYDGFSWIMNREGEIYMSSDKVLPQHSVTSDMLLKSVKQSNGFTSGIIHLNEFSELNSTVFYSSVPYAKDWILCTMIDNNKILEQTNQLINLLLIVCLLLFIVSILLSVFISCSITRPVERLKYHMLQAASGNLDTVFESKSHDEISVLGKVFNQMIIAIKNLISQIYSIQTQKRRAELRALQAQINPHFLYNTLDTIQWKALSRNACDVADMIQLLSQFFRISLSGGKEYITVEEEIAHVTCYLKIQEIRYNDKLKYEIDVDESAKQYLIPKLIIQPLVENAINHGLKPKSNRGTISISVKEKNNSLCISVSDDGVGFDEEKLKQIRHNMSAFLESDHYGLYNINERLSIAFDEKYSITVCNRPDFGAQVQIEIPHVCEGFEC